MHRFSRRSADARLLIIAAVLLACGCNAAPRNMTAVRAYYSYDFTSAREALRQDAATRNDEQVLLNNARLGIAALADGDLQEAEVALDRAFALLSTAGLNRDRTTAAILLHEGVRIWKGEPFEQAMVYHYVATLYALMGDWENARAASANSLFRLTDFGAHQTPATLVRRAAREPDYLERGYTAIDTNFALGFLMQAIASRHSGAPGADALLEGAVRINPELASIAEIIRQDEYDTLLIVDWGKGPTKIAYGPDQALVRFEPQESRSPSLHIAAGERTIAAAPIAANIAHMARDHRWNNLESLRQAKSAIGDVLLYGGAMTASIGADEDSLEAVLAGVGLMAAGLLSKSGARADTRYLEFLPHAVYLVPLKLGEPKDLRIGANGDAGSAVLEDLQPGTTDSPRTVYVRLLGPGSSRPVPGIAR